MTRRPSILFVNQHYWPDVAATGQVLSDLAEFLVGKGYEVGVLCSRGSYEGGRVEAPAREIRRGVRVVRIPSPGLGRQSHTGRMAEYGAFIARAAARLRRRASRSGRWTSIRRSRSPWGSPAPRSESSARSIGPASVVPGSWSRSATA